MFPIHPLPFAGLHSLARAGVVTLLALGTAPALAAAAPEPTSTAPAALPGAASPTQPTAFTANHRSGQTFLTWSESVDPDVLHYRVYRSDQPIDANNLASADLLYEVVRGSGSFHADRYVNNATGVWQPRYFERFVIDDLGPELPVDTGLLVWTLGEEDLGLAGAGDGYYAITSVDELGLENVTDFSTDNTLGPVREAIGTPAPVLGKVVPGIDTQIYIQYTDLRWINETLSAPNPLNSYYGLDDTDPAISGAVNYAFTYGLFLPEEGACAPVEPDYGIAVYLHGYGGQAIRPLTFDPNPTWCNAFRLHPIDLGNTWWFGNARDNDYRVNLQPSAGDVVVNYTEQRVLAMVDAILEDPDFGHMADKERVYVYGTSMGGSGALSMALRYPHVLAAAHASQPMTNYLTSGDFGGTDWEADISQKLGAIALDLPIVVEEEHPYQAELEPFEGTPAWDWQNHHATVSDLGDRETVPFGIDHGLQDTIIDWPSQGEPFYALLEAAHICWAGEVIDTGHSNSNLSTLPKPLEKSSGTPFLNFKARRDETVPGFCNSTENPALPPVAAGKYNADLEWSASWNPIDALPLDSADEWAMTLRSTSIDQFVDIQPRRTAEFDPTPGTAVRWENVRVSDQTVVDSGTLKVDALGHVVVPQFEVTTGSNRLRIQRSLAADVDTLSLSAGGQVAFDLRLGADMAGLTYYLVGSSSGTSPGIQLNPFFKLNLNFDVYMLDTIVQPNTFLANSLSTLDGDGRSTATLTVPAAFDPALAGLEIHHAFVLYDLPTSTDVVAVSNSIGFTLVP
jgi:pimeloyl-ACP methyl ester carboxylesterase